MCQFGKLRLTRNGYVSSILTLSAKGLIIMRNKTRQNDNIYYIQLEIIDERVGEVDNLLWMFSGNKELLTVNEDIFIPRTPIKQGNLSEKGKRFLKEHDIDINEQVVYCQNIKEFIL